MRFPLLVMGSMMSSSGGRALTRMVPMGSVIAFAHFPVANTQKRCSLNRDVVSLSVVGRPPQLGGFAKGRTANWRSPKCAVSSGSESENSAETSTLLPTCLPPTKLAAVVEGTRLSNCELGRLYNSARDGFDVQSFFDANFLFEGGVPVLVIGRTYSGVIFGGVNSVGFDRRNDYRDSVTCVLFALDKEGEVQISHPSTPQGSSAIFDFEDCAISFGPSDLRIPMNKEKHLINADCATSSLGASYDPLPNGQFSLLGDKTKDSIEVLETYVNLEFIEEAAVASQKQSRGNPFSGLAKSLFGGK